MEISNDETGYELPKTVEEAYAEQKNICFPDADDTNQKQDNGEITCEFNEYVKAEIERCNGDIDFYESSYNRYLYSSYPPDIGVYRDAEVEERLDDFQKRVDLRIEICGIEGSCDVRKDEQLVETVKKAVKRERDGKYAYLAAYSAYQEYTQHYGIPSEQKPEIDLGERVEAEGAVQLEEERQQMIKRFVEMKDREELEYLVRGAPIKCICGSHTRHLDMYHSHGVYVNGKAVAFEEDCVPDVNISYFGHCLSPGCTLTETISLKKGGAVNVDGAYLEEADDSIRVALKCVPDFDGKWQNAHEETVIAKEGCRGDFDEGSDSYAKALTTASYLLCKHGGLIYPLTSGQIDESYYHAPFMAYPFDDFGSEAFYNWCEKNDICPALPGEPEYYDWYKDKLDVAKEELEKLSAESKEWIANGGLALMMAGNTPPDRLGEHWKKMEHLYEECLDGAYRQGLDRMPEEERQKYIEMKDEYIELIPITDAGRETIIERYSGLRLNLGNNGR